LAHVGLLKTLRPRPPGRGFGQPFELAAEYVMIAALDMVDIANVSRPAIWPPRVSQTPRHPAIVRITHWVNALSFVGLVVSGIAILLAHPRLYWGETGTVGTPSLVDLPLPFVLTGQTGWGRSLHFLTAWISVVNGCIYGIAGLTARHFGKGFLRYGALQRRVYFTVVFVLFPVMIWTGLAMSPAVTSVFPGLATVVGGQQSARTIHFFAASALVVFLAFHVAMVWRAGFAERTWAMIAGPGEERA
jgi:thiosulfate reductase cytochrome b subunit